MHNNYITIIGGALFRGGILYFSNQFIQNYTVSANPYQMKESLGEIKKQGDLEIKSMQRRGTNQEHIQEIRNILETILNNESCKITKQTHKQISESIINHAGKCLKHIIDNEKSLALSTQLTMSGEGGIMQTVLTKNKWNASEQQLEQLQKNWKTHKKESFEMCKNIIRKPNEQSINDVMQCVKDYAIILHEAKQGNVLTTILGTPHKHIK